MWQAGTVAREFTQEFEWHARDAGMAEEDAKVDLVSVLNQDTLAVWMHTSLCVEVTRWPA